MVIPRLIFSIFYSFAITWTLWISNHKSITDIPTEFNLPNGLYVAFWAVWFISCFMMTSPRVILDGSVREEEVRFSSPPSYEAVPSSNTYQFDHK